MKKIILLLLALFGTYYAAEDIVVQNRILAKINTQAISVVDVTKKMDFIFFREFQAYAHSNEARLEFYETNWRSFLDDMIDEQLILSSAKELKVTVNDGEVRQEIEDTLGPNVIAKIDQMSLTYPEVFKIVQNDLIVRRMVYVMVQSKATASITPSRLKESYEKYSADHPVEEAWNYKVLTIRAQNELAAIAASQILLKSIDIEKKPIDEALQKIALDNIKITLSETMSRTAQSLSEAHKAILIGLKNKEHSAPIPSVKKDDETIFRIFFLDDHTDGGKVDFTSLEEKLKGALIQEAVGIESLAWRKKLRRRYGIDQDYLSLMVPGNFKPFFLQK